MLVLSRKESEKVVFPHLGVSLQILRVGGGKVRVGIEAPDDVAVIRYEIASPDQLAEFSERLQQSATRGELNHEVRNQLHTALLGLRLAHQQLCQNRPFNAEETIEQLIDSLQGLDHELGGHPLPEPLQRRRRALVVEDNSNERRLLAGYLALSGFDVHAVDDGLEALDYLSTHDQPDAVVLDMQMPRLGGAAAVSVMRSDPRFRGLKVYAVSGLDRGELQVPVGPEGVNYWFSKPLDPQQLVERINAELEPSAD